MMALSGRVDQLGNRHGFCAQVRSDRLSPSTRYAPRELAGTSKNSRQGVLSPHHGDASTGGWSSDEGTSGDRPTRDLGSTVVLGGQGEARRTMRRLHRRGSGATLPAPNPADGIQLSHCVDRAVAWQPLQFHSAIPFGLFGERRRGVRYRLRSPRPRDR